MQLLKLKKFLDLIPLSILVASAANLLWIVITTNISLQNRHYCGILFLLITIFVFLKKRKAGVLLVGATILLGVFNMLSFSPAIETFSLGGSVDEFSISSIKIQGIFVVWLIIYFTCCGNHLWGIATKKYWQNL